MTEPTQFRRKVNRSNACYQAYDRTDEKGNVTYWLGEKKDGTLRRMKVNKTTAMRIANNHDAQFAHETKNALDNAQRNKDTRFFIQHEKAK